MLRFATVLLTALGAGLKEPEHGGGLLGECLLVMVDLVFGRERLPMLSVREQPHLTQSIEAKAGGT